MHFLPYENNIPHKIRLLCRECTKFDSILFFSIWSIELSDYDELLKHIHKSHLKIPIKLLWWQLFPQHLYIFTINVQKPDETSTIQAKAETHVYSKSGSQMDRLSKK